MSTAYGWRCLTCATESECGWHRGQGGAVGALAHAARSGWDNIGLSQSHSGADSFWLEDHIGHEVVVVNEYGEVEPDDPGKVAR